jgi:hypothetical protein
MYPASRCFRLTNGCWLSRCNDGAPRADTKIVGAGGACVRGRSGSQLRVTQRKLVAGAGYGLSLGACRTDAFD